MIRKTFPALTTLALGAFLLTACGDDDGSPTDPGSAEAFQGCTQVFAHSIGSTVNANLTSSDCASISRSGRHAKYYSFTVQSARDVQIDMMSEDIDSYLYLWTRDGSVIASNDDWNWDTYDSRISMSLSAGDYVIEATTWGTGETGPFQLRTQ